MLVLGVRFMCHAKANWPMHLAGQVAFRGTDSHSWYNWAENMKYWRAKYQMPYPGSEGSLVHSGEDFFHFFLHKGMEGCACGSCRQCRRALRRLILWELLSGL